MITRLGMAARAAGLDAAAFQPHWRSASADIASIPELQAYVQDHAVLTDRVAGRTKVQKLRLREAIADELRAAAIGEAPRLCST